MGTTNHRVDVIRIAEIRKHPNADQLGLVDVGGYQVVVRLENYKVGDLAIYIPPDSVVPDDPRFDFIWNGPLEGEAPLKKRRVTVRRFRKEWSEGLLMPVSDFTELGGVIIGENVAEPLNIVHYEPPEPESLGGENERGPAKYRRPKSLKGWFFYLIRKIFRWDPNGAVGGDHEAKGIDKPVYDVEAYKHHRGHFIEGEPVIVTEKIHGSNARFVFEHGRMWAGSRRLWKKQTAASIWWKALEQHLWIGAWCREYEGHTLYGEVVPTQGGYDYGCKPGEVKFRAFDALTPEEVWYRPACFIGQWVPIIYTGPFNEDIIKPLAEGPSMVEDAKHIREGVVIRPENERHVHGLGRLHLKIVSLKFLEKETA